MSGHEFDVLTEVCRHCGIARERAVERCAALRSVLAADDFTAINRRLKEINAKEALDANGAG